MDESSLANMEVDSGSSIEMPNENKKLEQKSDVLEESKKDSEKSVSSFIEDAIEIISATSPSIHNNLS